MCFSTLIFDLDDTLYPSYSGLWDAIRERMNEYMFERLKIPFEEIPHIRQRLLDTYGTTLRGLQHEFEVDTDDFLSYVHDLPLEEYISPNPELRQILLSLPQERWIFTNADSFHAKRVLAVLKLEDCFKGIIDIRSLNFLCKPDKAAYVMAMKIMGNENPQESILFDDSIRNLAPARELGFFTFLIGKKESHPSVDKSLLSLNDLPQEMPELWK
jgi:pyrimidine 5'-nucleotidase